MLVYYQKQLVLSSQTAPANLVGVVELIHRIRIRIRIMFILSADTGTM